MVLSSGLCEVCSGVDCQLMAFPGSQKGTVQIVVSLNVTNKLRSVMVSFISVRLNEVLSLINLGLVVQQGTR